MLSAHLLGSRYSIIIFGQHNAITVTDLAHSYRGSPNLSRSQPLFTALSLALTLNPSPQLGEGL